MYLLRRIDFIALLGLFVQAFVAWVFVAVLASLRRRSRGEQRPFGDWLAAFAALAASLTVMSVRFFETFEESTSRFWIEGGVPARSSYVAYQTLKTLFGAFLVRGAYALSERRPPRAVVAAGWIGGAFFSLSPLVEPDVTDLLAVQAPFMIGCAITALRALPRATEEDSGLRLVRAALTALAATWTLHLAAAVSHRVVDALHYVLPFNSFIDLGVQIALGTGLIISTLQNAHRRLRAAEADRERLRREIERDERLRALGTLVSGVAHELNNPLTAILGHAEELVESGVGGESAVVVREQAERCRGIVRSLSALASQTVHPPTALDAGELVRRVARGVEAEFAARGARLEASGPPGVSLRADRTGAEQVLTNLLVNAAHASPVGGVVRATWTADSDGVALTVTDEGPGVPVAVRARLFEPFFTTKGPGRGTGLGLAVAHAIVRAHGGTLTVDDAPSGRGALFRARFPAATADAAPGARVAVGAESAATAAETRPPHEAPRVLVVDDEAAVRHVVRRLGERRGWIVDEAASAEDAFRRLARTDDVDVVLCDLRMPGVGGVGLHDRFAEERPALLERTVFFTGDLASPDVARFAASARRPLLSKPFDAAALAAAVEAVARRGAAPQDGAARSLRN
jgi:signal transduction histidine kinase/ActR/RegA family two-component response regulator